MEMSKDLEESYDDNHRFLEAILQRAVHEGFLSLAS